MNFPPEFEKAYPEIKQHIIDIEEEIVALQNENSLLKTENERYQRRIRIFEKQRPPAPQSSDHLQVRSPVKPIQDRKNRF